MSYEMTKWASFTREFLEIKLGAPIPAEVAKKLVSQGGLLSKSPSFRAVAAGAPKTESRLLPGVLEHLTEGAPLAAGPARPPISPLAQQFVQGTL